MCSDHPGTTPNALPLWSFFSTCKGETKSLWRLVAGLVGKKEMWEKTSHGYLGPTEIPQGWTICIPLPDRPQVKIWTLIEPLMFLVIFNSTTADRPLPIGGPSASQSFCPVCSKTFLSDFINCVRIVRHVLSRLPRISVIFLKVEFELGIIAHKHLQNFQQKYASKQ
jgi:hypothetical protein